MIDPIQELIRKVINTNISVLPMAHLYQKHKPKTKQEYAKVIDDHLKKSVGFGLNEIIKRCFNLRTTINETANLDSASIRHSVLDNLVVSKMKGFEWEEKAKEMIEIVFPTIGIKYNQAWDIQYAIDFVLYQKNSTKHYYGIQVKSKSIIHSTDVTVQKAYKDAKAKHILFQQQFGIPATFLFYGNEYFCNFPEVVSEIHLALKALNDYYDIFNSDFKNGLRKK